MDVSVYSSTTASQVNVRHRGIGTGDARASRMDTVPDEFLANDSPDRAHVLVAICSARGPLATVAEHICDQVRAEGHIADLADASTGAMPLPPDYELVVVGLTGIRACDRRLRRWIASVGGSLAEMPSAVFAVGRPEKLARTLARAFAGQAWRPAMVEVISDDSDLTTRRFARRITRLLRDASRSG
jgi:menaquinone-dependent protoporphyrinogen IX oxidase